MVEAEIALGYFCGRCRQHWQTYLRAEACCGEACADCATAFGALAVRYPGDDGQGRCWVCWRAREAAKERQRYGQAQPIPAEGYTGPVYWENRDRYFSTATEAFVSVEDQVLGGEIERVEVRVYACRLSRVQLTADMVLALVLEDLAPGSGFDSEARLVMSSFLELYNRRYADQMESWFPDYVRKVIFPESWWASSTLGGPRLCPGCRGVDGEHDFGVTCTLREEGEGDG